MFRAPILLILTCVAATASDVYFLPINVETSKGPLDGLIFYFEHTLSREATITVDSLRHGKAVTHTEVIDTDRIHGTRLVFRILLDAESRQKLARVRIVIDGVEFTIRDMAPATVYPLKLAPHAGA